MPDQIIEAVKQAASGKVPVKIIGGNSKSFYGCKIEGEDLDVSGYKNIVSYEPTELVVTARCGTPISEVEALLAEQNQMLPFEPSHFGGSATVGGTIACGLSGPARPYTGSVRDYVLGVRMINGKGEDLTFGGQVMKNVAGFDVSRLMTGSLGTLGVILEVSFKLLPKPEATITIQQECNQQQAIALMNKLAGQALPLSATCYEQGKLSIRLSGFSSAIESAKKEIGGEMLENSDAYWRSIKEHQHDFFVGDKPLWRIAVPPATEPLDLDEDCFVEWGGAQRWYRSGLPAEQIREIVHAQKGHATLFRHGDDHVDVFSPLSPEIKKIHQRLKESFDPDGIFNIGKMYSDL